MILGVFSDSHGRGEKLRRAMTGMGRVDAYFFAGDGLGDVRGTDWPAPIHAVRGNCDYALGTPALKEVWLEDRGILLTHGHAYGVELGLDRLADLGKERGVHLVIYGHTHRPMITRKGDILLLNPGSVHRNRPGGGASYAVVYLERDRILPFIHEL